MSAFPPPLPIPTPEMSPPPRSHSWRPPWPAPPRPTTPTVPRSRWTPPAIRRRRTARTPTPPRPAGSSRSVELEFDRVPAHRVLVPRLAAQRVDQRALIPVDHLVGEVGERLRDRLLRAEGLEQHHRLLTRLGVEELEGHEVLVALEEARKADHGFHRRHLPAQLLLAGFLVPRGALLGLAEVPIEEVPRALQVLEDPQVVVGRLPGMRDEEADGIGLRHMAKFRTRAVRREACPLCRARASPASLGPPAVAADMQYNRPSGLAFSGLPPRRTASRCDCSSITSATPQARARPSTCRCRVPGTCAAIARSWRASRNSCAPRKRTSWDWSRSTRARSAPAW